MEFNKEQYFQRQMALSEIGKEGQGLMNNLLMDVHGAGCQRSDPKSGNINEYPQFFGPKFRDAF